MPLQNLLRDTEILVAISIAHLSPVSRQRLADGTLSALAYPNDYGGFVYAGVTGEALPLEPELAVLVKAACPQISSGSNSMPTPCKRKVLRSSATRKFPHESATQDVLTRRTNLT